MYPVHPAPGKPWALEDAVRFILFDIWYIVRPLAEREFWPILEGTWAGEVLGDMKSHYRATVEYQRREDERNDPERARQHRQEKRHLRQEAHKQRLAKKEERDRIWWETHKKDQS